MLSIRTLSLIYMLAILFTLCFIIEVFLDNGLLPIEDQGWLFVQPRSHTYI